MQDNMCYKNELEDCEPAPQRAAGPTLAIAGLASEYYVSAWTVLITFESAAAALRAASTANHCASISSPNEVARSVETATKSTAPNEKAWKRLFTA